MAGQQVTQAGVQPGPVDYRQVFHGKLEVERGEKREAVIQFSNPAAEIEKQQTVDERPFTARNSRSIAVGLCLYVSLICLEEPAGRSDTMVGDPFVNDIPPRSRRRVIDRLKNLIRHAVVFQSRMKSYNGIGAQFVRHLIPVERHGAQPSAVNTGCDGFHTALPPQPVKEAVDGTVRHRVAPSQVVQGEQRSKFRKLDHGKI